jgi:pimeloyl-ACP methyl ester carboxylesterase
MQIKVADGRKLSYVEYGDLKGKPLFYFHGWPSSRLTGLETDEAAKKLGVRVISVDRPGFGLSDYQENRTLLDWADDVVELADYLKIKRLSVMGVSGGGPYAAVCAYKIPQRLLSAGIVVGLAPTWIKGNLDGMSLAYKLSWQSYPKSRFFQKVASLWAYIFYKYLGFLSCNYSFMAKEDQKLMTKEFTPGMNQRILDAFNQGIKGPAWDLYLYTKDWGFDLRDIKTKVYLWYGASDRNAPLAMGKYYASQIPGSKLTVLEGGHLSRKKHMEEIIKTLVD